MKNQCAQVFKSRLQNNAHLWRRMLTKKKMELWIKILKLVYDKEHYISVFQRIYCDSTWCSLISNRNLCNLCKICQFIQNIENLFEKVLKSFRIYNFYRILNISKKRLIKTKIKTCYINFSYIECAILIHTVILQAE